MAYFRSNVSGGIPAGVKALPTVDTASGSIATFDTDMTENLVEVKCQIVATQSGSGTPSPSNPRPIITYNQLNLAHIGNTDKMSWLQGVTSGIYGIVDLGSLTWGIANNRFYSSIPTKYIGTGTLANIICPKYITSIYNQQPDKTISSYAGYVYINDTAYTDIPTFKTAMNGVYLIYELATPTFPTTYTASDFNAMLTSFGIDGSLYNIPFGQTVAQGVLNVGTGKLRVTHEIVTYTGDVSEGWAKNAEWFYISLPNDYRTDNTPIVNIYNAVSPRAYGALNNLECSLSTAYEYFNIRDNQYATLADFQTALSNQNLQVVYELATPIEIQLDSITLQALLNENNIWCDTGDTEVKFLLTVGKKVA